MKKTCKGVTLIEIIVIVAISLVLGLIIVGAIFGNGCKYRVVDSSGVEYYTDSIEHNGDGSITFQDGMGYSHTISHYAITEY